MKFTITAKCAAGHTEEFTHELPGREWAEELARVFGIGKCGICDAQLEVTVRNSIDQN